MTDERAINASTYSSLISAVPNTLDAANNDQNNKHQQIENKNKIKLQENICQPVFVALKRLYPEVYKKDLNSRIKKNDQSRVRKSRQKKYKEEEKESVKNTETVVTLNRYKLRSKNKNVMTKQNIDECNDTTIKQLFKNSRNTDAWKYKRKYNDSFTEECVNTSDMSTEPKKKSKRTKLKFKQNNDKLTGEKLLSHATYSNITDTKVVLTKLEDMHDNKYIMNWKKQFAQKALLTKNLECSEQYRNLSTSASSINSVGSSHEDTIEDNEDNASAKKSSSSYDLKSKYKQLKNLKVMLVKLESLGVSIEEQNLALKVEQLIANYNSVLKLNSLTYSNNIVSNSSESNISNNSSKSNIINKSIDEASAQMSSAGKDNDTVDQHPTNEPTIDSSLSDSVSQDTVSTSKELLKKSDNGTNESELMALQESTENVGVFQQPVEQMDESVILPERVENSQDIGYLMEALVNKETEMDCSNNVITQVDVNNTSLTTNLTAEVNRQPVVQIDESAILPEPVENSQDINFLTEAPGNNETEMDCSNNVITQPDVNNTSLTTNLIAEAQKINELNSDVTMSAESIEQSINNSFRYTCIACNSSFQEFRALPLHLKECLGKSKEGQNVHDNNIKDNVYNDSAKIAETQRCGNISKSSLQQPSLTTKDNSKSLSTLTKKLSKRKHREKKKKLQTEKNEQCNVCSEVFDSIVSLSDHIYKHTEPELRKAYEIAKKKQTSALNDSNKKTKNAVTTKHKKAQVANVTIEQKKTQVNEAANTSQSLIQELDKQISDAPMNYVSAMTFCDCHKPKSNDERCIELVLHCSICKIIFRTKECFDAHLKNTEPYFCNSKELIGTIQRLYCSSCQIMLYSFVDMRRHIENHIKNQQNTKLFCHLCKVRFIGMGPIFNLHWFNHMRNVSYTATAANFPKNSLVDFNSKTWSLITSDNYNYLIVTEHVCNFCNEQFFATNQLQNHIPICPKRKNIELSRTIPANNDKEHNIDSELNLRFFCTLCKVMFKEKSLFETHAVSHKQHLQPQYICLSMTGVKRMYICNVCANVYENLKEFTTHWQDHNAIRETFMCYQCKKNFPTLETFVDHLKQCDVSSIPVDMPSCQVTYNEAIHNCKVCNIGFESYKALYQHSGIHNIQFPRSNRVSSNEAQNDSIAQKISSLCPKDIRTDTEKLTIASNDSNVEVITIDSNVAEKKDSTPEVFKNVIGTCTQSKSSTESKLAEYIENEIDNTSVNNNSNFTDADTEVLSLLSDLEADDLNRTQEVSCPGGNDETNNSISKDKETEVITAGDVNPSNKVSVIHTNSNEKTDLNETSSSLKNLEINETQTEHDVIMVEPVVTNKETKNAKNKSPVKVPEKNNDTPKDMIPNNSNEKTDLNETSSSLKNLEINETQIEDDVILIEPVVSNKETKNAKNKSPVKAPEKNNDTPKEAPSNPKIPNDTPKEAPSNPKIPNDTPKEAPSNPKIPNDTPKEAPSDPKSNDSSESNNKTINDQKYLRVKNISELIDNRLKYLCSTCGFTFDSQKSLENHSMTHNQDPSSMKIQLLLPNFLSGGDIIEQDSKKLANPTLVLVTDSPNNFVDNNHLIPTSSNASTAMLSNLPANNVVPNQNYVRAQPQDTHSRIKLQNAIHQKCSDKTPNVTPINVLPKPTPVSNVKLQQTYCLPISSANQYHSNTNFSAIRPSTGVANPLKNNQMVTINMNNAGQISTFYYPSTKNPNVPSPTQQHTANQKTSTSDSMYLCHYCRQITYFPTVQRLNDHFNNEHNYPCEICHARMFDLNDLRNHMFQHNATYNQNTFQRQ